MIKVKQEDSGAYAGDPLKEIRCKRCKRLLMKGYVMLIEIKCPKCGYLQIIESEDDLYKKLKSKAKGQKG